MSAAAQSTGPASAPIFTSEPEGFALRLHQAAEAVGRAVRAGAPEPCMVSITDERVSITPWHPGAPLQGLLLWAEHLTGAEWSAQVHPPLSTGNPITSVYVTGTVAGLPVELASSSWRPVPGFFGVPGGGRQPVDPMELARLAGLEQPYGALA